MMPHVIRNAMKIQPTTILRAHLSWTQVGTAPRHKVSAVKSVTERFFLCSYAMFDALDPVNDVYHRLDDRNAIALHLWKCRSLKSLCAEQCVECLLLSMVSISISTIEMFNYPVADAMTKFKGVNLQWKDDSEPYLVSIHVAFYVTHWNVHVDAQGEKSELRG